MRSENHDSAECGRGLSDNKTEIHESVRPILETCPGRAETSVPDLQQRVVRHCSPTLAGLKCGSMFRVGSDLHGIRRQLHDLEIMLMPRGVRTSVISCDDSGCLVYVYRPNRLEELLSRPDVESFLAGYGYAKADAVGMVSQLTDRFSLCPSMPPEVGVFLDYPLEDVKGYIENGGRCCRCIGCWKVYGDVESAEKRFRTYRRCRDVFSRRFAEGCELSKLAVRARSEPGVQGPLLLPVRFRLAGGFHLVQDRSDTILRESVVGHHPEDAFGVRLPGSDVVVLRLRAVEEYLADFFVSGDVVAFGLDDLLEGAVLLYELQTLLRTDPGDPGVEVRADHDADVHQLLPGDPQVAEHPVGVDHFRCHGLVDALAGDLAPAGDGEVPHQEGGSEQEGIEILGCGCVHIAPGAHVCALGLSVAGCLDDGDAHEGEELLGCCQDLGGHPGGLLRLGERLLHVPLGQGLLVLDLRLLPAGDALLDGSGLELAGLPVEDEGGFDAVLYEIGGSVEESGEVGCHPSLVVRQGLPIGLPYYREELEYGVVSVDGDGLPAEVRELYGGRFDNGG